MQTLSLNGEWRLQEAGSATAIAGRVPGCVHTDLLAAGRIVDPFPRDNEHQVLWVAERDWTYSRTFNLPAELLAHERVLLRCRGLDTLARVLVNGTEVGVADNMFRTWEFDVAAVLRAGDNTIEIRFASPLKFVQEKGQLRQLPAWGVGQHKLDGGGWIRKQPCSFGWDWGPMLASSGIWRDIELVAFNTARLADVRIVQQHTDGAVTLRVDLAAERVGEAELRAEVNVRLDGREVAAGEATLEGDAASLDLRIDDPQLWWPAGLGAQPLYEVEVRLLDGDGERDIWRRRVGLRTLELVREPDEWGESFHFAANGVPFFAKGANWIPADAFITRLTRDDYAQLLADAVAANMNMLRVWGGGIYEQDDFYELCDELGICVWQDFMFACATYPGFDPDFRDSVAAEVTDNVRRLRHHACLALWCGNNELEQGLVGECWSDRCMSWEDYSILFDDLIPGLLAELDPERPYWPSSPHTPGDQRGDFNNPDRGDAHLWSVWHGKQPFEWYRTCTHRFNSEFGFQSFPEPDTVRGYTAPEERNITSYVMELHQRSGIGNSTIIHYMLDWFRLPTSFDHILWLSQILQGMAIKYACEHWRRQRPRGMGTLYWQLNDCWPVASWSSIDYHKRWKALHHMARRFFAPLMVSGVENPATGQVEIHVTCDRLEGCEGEVAWRVTDVAGAELVSGSRAVAIEPAGNQLVETLDVSGPLAEQGARNLLVWLELRVDGEVVSDNLVLFARPKHLALGDPGLSVDVQPDGDGACTVTLSAERPALWAWVEYPDARLSDNFVHLAPGRPVTLRLTPPDGESVEAVRGKLRLYSLVDTYQ